MHHALTTYPSSYGKSFDGCVSELLDFTVDHNRARPIILMNIRLHTSPVNHKIEFKDFLGTSADHEQLYVSKHYLPEGKDMPW